MAKRRTIQHSGCPLLPPPPWVGVLRGSRRPRPYFKKAVAQWCSARGGAASRPCALRPCPLPLPPPTTPRAWSRRLCMMARSASARLALFSAGSTGGVRGRHCRMGQRCCRQYEMFQGRINWIKLAGGLNTQQKQAQHSRARESKEPGPPASRLVVGSSRARMPQLRQNVSASARRMMRQASTWWRRWRVVAGGGGGGREVLCALPCRLSRVRQALLLFQSVLGRRTLQTSLYNSPTPMQRPPPPPLSTPFGPPSSGRAYPAPPRRSASPPGSCRSAPQRPPRPP